jgi:excisionase family DNA binding protein
MPPADTPPRRSLTVPEAACHLRVGQDKIRRWITLGELRAINTASALCGRPRWVIPPDALAAFERSRAAGPAPGPARRRKRTTPADFYPD